MSFIQRQLGSLIALLGKRRRGRPYAQGAPRGSQDQILPGGTPRREQLRMLDIPEIPLRPINLDHSIPRSLLEMSEWSVEFSGCNRLLSQNVFQDQQGEIGSWSIREKNPDGTPLDNPPDSYVLGLARDLANRYQGKEMILGGQQLEAAVRKMFALGDCFMELAIDKDGMGGWAIARSIYLPTFSVFVDEDEHGQLTGYHQKTRLDSMDDARSWTGEQIARILHFRAPGTGRYGLVSNLALVEPWEEMKGAVADLAEAARTSSVLPTLHYMPEEKDEAYKQQYRAEHEESLTRGIITNLYLSHGAKVEKMAAATPTLKPLIDYYLQLRYRCVPSGIPIFLVNGLGLEQGSSKELGGQPALAYARLISTLRSYLAEQILWAIGVEVTLNRGYEYWLEQRPKVHIEWPQWVTQEMPGLTPVQTNQAEQEQAEEEAKESFIKVNQDQARQLLLY